LTESLGLIEEVVSRNLTPSAALKQKAPPTAAAGTDADLTNARFSENPEPAVIKEQSKASTHTAAIPMPRELAAAQHFAD
jgi:hypothetical protein